MAGSGLDVDSVIERLLSVRGQPNNRTVQLAEGEIRALCATARCVSPLRGTGVARIRNLHGFFSSFLRPPDGKLGFVRYLSFGHRRVERFRWRCAGSVVVSLEARFRANP